MEYLSRPTNFQFVVVNSSIVILNSGKLPGLITVTSAGVSSLNMTLPCTVTTSVSKFPPFTSTLSSVLPPHLLYGDYLQMMANFPSCFCNKHYFL